MDRKGRRIYSVPSDSHSLPPIHSDDGANMTQLKPAPPAYMQESARSTRTNSPRVQEQPLPLSAQPPPSQPSSTPHSQLTSSSGPSAVVTPPPPPPPLPGKAATSDPSLITPPIPPPPPLPPGNHSSKKSPLPLVPKPPATTKYLSNGPAYGKHGDELPAVHLRLTEEYVASWTVRDDDIERCVEDVEFVTKSLQQKPLSIVIIGSMELTQLFWLICKAISGGDICSQSSKARMVELIVEKGWVSFIRDYLQHLLTMDNWDHKYLSVACENLIKALQLCFPILDMEPEVACQIFDQYFDVLYSCLNHPSTMEIASGSALSPGSSIVRALLVVIENFALVPEIRDSKITAENLENLRQLLTKYTQLLRDGSRTITACHRALNFLEEDDISLPRLPRKYMVNTDALENDPDQYTVNIAYVVKRLSSVSIDCHLTKPWKYEQDFRFLLHATKAPKLKSDYSMQNWNRYYCSLLKDGVWHKLLVDLHSAALRKVKKIGETGSVIECALFNILYGFASIRNGTNNCKDSQLQQQTFGDIFEHILQSLQDPFVRTAMAEGDGVTAMIGATMVTSLHNLSYYHEPSVPVMRAKSMISIARQVRNCVEDSGITTDCLLIIAFLMNESDDKKWLRTTDEELSYLLDELRKSMLAASSSTYKPEELIDGLNRISVSDINKLKLIESGILKLLAKSFHPLKKYTVAHRTAAAKAVWNLAFSDESRKEIKERKGLMAALKSLKSSTDQELRAAVAGALWQLEGKEKHLVDLESSASVSDVQQRHIMLSYNHQAKVEVFRMKDRLKEEGYKVWIDEEQITAGGSTLEAMSKAIEDSCLVLIFFSEPYKNSVNCRAEAEYVFERRKPFLPIQVQAGYTPEGWLGILFGSKYRYTLSKPDRYDSEVTGLLGKVREVISGQLQPVVANDTDAPVASDKRTASTIAQSPVRGAHQSLKCESWSAQEISEWFDGNGLNEFKASLERMDADVLGELATLSCYHKDTFYTLLMSTKTPGMSVGAILKFGRAVQKLAIE